MHTLNLVTNDTNRTFHFRTSNEDAKEEQKYSSTLSLTSAEIGRGAVIYATPRPLNPRDIDAVSKVQEAGWVPGPVWTVAETLAPTGIRSPDCPARSGNKQRLISKGSVRGNVLQTAVNQ
jgi:hypothetical protein